MKTVLVTGAARGIGKACADYFQSQNWKVVAIDLTPMAGNYSLKIQGDILSLIENGDLLKKLQADKINLDCIISNAAIQIEHSIQAATRDQWNSVLGINVLAPFFLVQKTLSLMNPLCSVINISSVHARATSTGMISYVTSKGALSAMTRALAIELGPKKIRVNAILPGAIDTDMLNQGLQRQADPQQARKKLEQSSPLNKMGNPQDIAYLAYFLADSEKSANITGQEFVSDSGILSKLSSE